MPAKGKKRKPSRFSSVDDYLRSQDPVKARTLRSVIDFILAEFPELESKISWNVPQIHRNGKYVFGLAAFKNHLSLAPWSPRLINDFRARLAKFAAGSNSFQVPGDWEIDKKLLTDLVAARLTELGSKLESKIDRKSRAHDPETRVPADLGKALVAEAKAKTQWKGLTPIARRDFVSWVDSARQAETRKRRIEKACSMLAAGKRRPCCYSIVSFDLFTALAANAKAKAQWSDLTPTERRDFLRWMDSEKERKAHKRRVEKACSILAAGKRRP